MSLTPPNSQKAFERREREFSAADAAADEFEQGDLEGEFADALDAAEVIDELWAHTEWRGLIGVLQVVAPETFAEAREHVIEKRAEEIAREAAQ